MKTVVITGAGGAYAQYLAAVFKYEGYRTIGISRSEKLNSERFDVTIHADISRDESISEIEKVLAGLNMTVSVIIANAGNRAPTDHLENLSTTEISDLINIHCNSALRILKACRKYVLEPFKFVAVSSRFSSFAVHEEGYLDEYRPLYSYSIAKAALNMLCMRLRMEYTVEKIKIYLVHPGKLTTGIRAADSTDDPDESARLLIRYIHSYEGNKVQLFDLMNDKVMHW